jgi:hypothetical protein
VIHQGRMPARAVMLEVAVAATAYPGVEGSRLAL